MLFLGVLQACKANEYFLRSPELVINKRFNMCENITGQLIQALKQNEYNTFISLQSQINKVEQLEIIRETVINLIQLKCDGLELFYGFMVLNSVLHFNNISVYTVLQSVNEFKHKELAQLNTIMIAIYDFLKEQEEQYYQNHFPQAIIQIIKYLIAIITSARLDYIHEFMGQLIIQISNQENLDKPKFSFNIILLYQLLKQVIQKYEYNEFNTEIYQINIQINYLLQNIQLHDQKYEKVLVEIVKLLNLSFQGYGNQIDSEEFQNQEQENNQNYKICLISQELKQYLNQYVGQLLSFYYNNFDVFYETLFNICSIVQINQRQTVTINEETVEQCDYEYRDLLRGLVLSNLHYMRYCIENNLYNNFSKAMYLIYELLEHENVNVYALTEAELDDFKNALVYVFQNVIGITDSGINYMQFVLIYKKFLTITQQATEIQDSLSGSLQYDQQLVQQVYTMNQDLNRQLFEALLTQKENTFLLQLMQLIDDNYIYQQLVNKLHDFKILLNIIYNNNDELKINELIGIELQNTQTNIYYIALLFNRFLNDEICYKLIQTCFDIIYRNLQDFNAIIAIILSLQRLTQLYSLSSTTQGQCIQILQQYISHTLIQQQLSKALLYCNNLSVDFVQFLQKMIIKSSDTTESSQLISDELFDLFCSKVLIIYDTQQLSMVSGQFLQSYFNIRYIIAMTTNNSYQNIQYLEVPKSNKQLVEQLTTIDVNSSANPCFILANFRQMVHKKYFHAFDKIVISYLRLLGDQQANYLQSFSSYQLVQLLDLCKRIFPVLLFNNQEQNTYLDEDDIYQIRINVTALEAAIIFLHNTLLNYNYYNESLSVEESDEYLLDIVADTCLQLYLVKKSQYVIPILQWQLLQQLFFNNQHLAHGLQQISNIMLTMNQLGFNYQEQVTFLINITKDILNYSFNQIQYDRKFLAFISMMSQMNCQIEIFCVSIVYNLFCKHNSASDINACQQSVVQKIKQIFSQEFQITDEAINQYPSLLRDSVTREVAKYAFQIIEQINQQGISLEDQNIQMLYKETYNLVFINQ